MVKEIVALNQDAVKSYLIPFGQRVKQTLYLKLNRLHEWLTISLSQFSKLALYFWWEKWKHS